MGGVEKYLNRADVNAQPGHTGGTAPVKFSTGLNDLFTLAK